jgi:predicted nucleic acid-binding protein
MAHLFLDASAVVRRYDASESGSAHVVALCGQAESLILSTLAVVEVASAFGRKLREGRLDAQEVATIWTSFELHLRNQYLEVALNQRVRNRAAEILLRSALRASDAVHIAAAQIVVSRTRRAPLEFVTGDVRQAAIARAEGLSVTLLT